MEIIKKYNFFVWLLLIYLKIFNYVLLHLFINKFRYWFIDDEIDELNKRNNEFSMISQEEELLNYYYSNKLPEFSNAVFKCIPPAILLAELQQKTKQNLSPKKLGEALTKLGYVKRQMGSAKTSSWQVYQKSEFEINQQQTE